MTDLLNPEDHDANADKAGLRERRAVDDLKWLMADARGRRFVARLLDRAGVHRSVFHTSGSVMAFNEGRRQVGLDVLAEVMEHTPKAYVQLLNEYRNEH
jgi:hypothetical protein